MYYKKYWIPDELENQHIDKIYNINLNDEALKLFMRNNFEITTNKQIYKNYYDENIFDFESNNNFINPNSLKDTVFEDATVDEQYDLKAYIRINSKLISDINDLDNKLKTLNNEQTEVIEYIKQNLDNQMLIFLKVDVEKRIY